VGAGFYFKEHFAETKIYLTTISWWRLALSLLFILIARLVLVKVAVWSVESEGWYFPYLEMLKIYAITQLAKYLPGGIWQYVGRYGFYRSKAMNNKQTIRGMITENIWLISSAAIVGSLYYIISKLSLIHI
jgi:hypothetical protein